MRVLFFHPALAPYRLDFFNLLADRCEIEVVFLRDNLQSQDFDQQRLLDKAKFKYRFLTKGFLLRGRLFRFGVQRAIEAACPDVVLGYEFSPTSVWIAHLSRKAKWRFWTTTDDNAEQARDARGMRKRLRNYVLGRADGLITTNAQVDDAIRSVCRGIENLQFAHLPIIHDTVVMRRNENRVVSAGKRWREELRCGQGCKVLLFVGRLAKIKNLDWLIDEIASINFSALHSATDLKLVLVGDGPEEAKCREKVEQLELGDRVLFAGRKEGEALYACMSAADALVLCSHSETYGAVVGEAMQWGTPCLVRDTCGVKLLIGARNEQGVSMENGVVFNLSNFVPALDAVLTMKRGTDSILPVTLPKCVDEIVKRMEDGR